MKTITVLGNNSGRNAGDMGILGNLLRDVKEQYPDVEFLVPTTNPKYIKEQFGHFNVKPVGMLPWNFAIKNLGWPLYRAMTNCDMVLICDNILFDRQFYNPLFNNLFSISLFAPICKRKGIPIVLYNVSVGPIDFPKGKKALQKVLDATELVVTRDSATQELFDKIGVEYPELHIHADCALNTEAPSPQRIDEIISKEGLFTNPNGTVGFNVNAYIDHWSPGGEYSRADFCRDIGAAADIVIEKLDVDVIFFVTQHMDLPVSLECVDNMQHKDRAKTISNVDYTYEEIAPLLGKVEVHNGLRTHTLIFSAAMHTPMIGITSYPKSAGFLRTVGMGDWQVPFADLTPENLANKVMELFAVREDVSKTMAPIVEQEKRKAKDTAKFLGKWL